MELLGSCAVNHVHSLYVCHASMKLPGVRCGGYQDGGALEPVGGGRAGAWPGPAGCVGGQAGHGWEGGSRQREERVQKRGALSAWHTQDTIGPLLLPGLGGAGGAPGRGRS